MMGMGAGMMMNQMMGMSMMMNSPLAMMGMGAGMMAAPQLSMLQTAGGAAKAKKDEKGKKEKPDDKAKKEVRDRDHQRKPDAAASGATSAAAGSAGSKPPTKDGKLDWSKRKDAMIDADDL